MKKAAALILAVALTALFLVGCGGNSSSNGDSKSSDTKSESSNATSDSAQSDDWSYIQNKGEMIIGITYFEPMNYKDENGELTGFETEFAKAVCAELGVEPKFQEINWDTKEVELKSKTIDCIWNGMTITDERKEAMSISDPYMENKQVMVTKESNVEKYSTAEGVKEANVVAEAGSAGETVAKEDAFFKDAVYLAADSQAKALMEVKAGTSDIAIIDYVMSIGTLRAGSDYSDLKVVEAQSFSPEQYGVAFRKDSDTTQKVNEAMKKLAENGKLKEIADKYSLTDLVIVK